MLLAEGDDRHLSLTIPHDVDAVDVRGPDTDRLACQGLADLHHPLLEPDRAMLMHAAHDIVCGIHRLGQDLRIGTRAGDIARRGDGHAQCLMRTLGVVPGPESVEDRLGMGQIHQRPPLCRNVVLDGLVAAFDLALGLGMQGTAVDDRHAEPQQPGFEATERSAVRRSPGRAVVGEDGRRQANGPEAGDQDLLDAHAAFVRTGNQRQQKAGMVVNHRQGMNTAARRERRVADEIHLPQLVRRRPFKTLKGTGHTRSGTTQEVVSTEDAGDGTGGWGVRDPA